MPFSGSVEKTPVAAKFGLITRKEQWRLTLRGWLFVCLVSLIIMAVVVSQANRFLSLNKSVHAQVLVLEEHVPEYDSENAGGPAALACARRFRKRWATFT